MALLPQVVYRFNTISTEIPMAFFAEMEKPILSFIYKYKGPRILKAILKRNKAQSLTLPKLTKYTTTPWYQHRDRYTDNGIEWRNQK